MGTTTIKTGAKVQLYMDLVIGGSAWLVRGPAWYGQAIRVLPEYFG